MHVDHVYIRCLYDSSWADVDEHFMLSQISHDLQFWAEIATQ